MALLEIKNLTFGYPHSGKVLNNISMDIQRGDFVAVCGPTGSGKTTLLRLLKPELTSLGDKSGEVFFNGVNTAELKSEESCKIGFVQQSPEHQIVTDKVWHEVVFGMENLHFDQSLMERRLAEIMAYFGIDNLFDSKTDELSGGQKQMVALAGVLAMNPEVIILDEPTSQLDPVAASDFLTTLKKLNDDLGLTVIISEHRLENILPLCSKLCVLNDGTVAAYGEPQEAIKRIIDNERLTALMPGTVRLYKSLGARGECPLNISQGKEYFKEHFNPGMYSFEKEKTSSGNPAVKLKNVFFRYDKNSPDVLKDSSLEVYEGEIFCVLGSNGSGKSTLLYAIAGLLRPYSGKIEILGQNIKKYREQSLYDGFIALLPQDVQTMFLRSTLKDEFDDLKIKFEELPFDLSYAAGIHPYDLSGGEQQLAAMAIALSAKPKILLLDEPTKGLDNLAKFKICDELKKLRQRGLTVIIVTHDVEFAAQCADRAALFFRGKPVCVDTPRKFFSENIFYTTSVAKIASGVCTGLIVPEDLNTFAGSAEQ